MCGDVEPNLCNPKQALYGNDPIVASVTFGCARDFDVRSKPGMGTEKLRWQLADGDVLVMGGVLQSSLFRLVVHV